MCLKNTHVTMLKTKKIYYVLKLMVILCIIYIEYLKLYYVSET